MPKPVETVRARTLRRRILETLRAAEAAGAGGWMDVEGLAEFLDPDCPGLTVSEARSACAYLEGKRYIRMRPVERRRDAPRRYQVKIRPAGIDLLEESTGPDPGVQDPRL